MKKHLIGITLLLIFTFSLVIYGYWYIINSADDFLTVINNLEEKIEGNEWNRAQKKVNLLDEEWNNIKQVWTPLLDHTEIDKLDISITRVVKLVELRNKNRALAEIAVVRKLVEHIPDTEHPTIRNIF